MDATMQVKRGTSASAASNNIILAEGEIGYITDAPFGMPNAKMGDGATHWNDLGWWTPGGDWQSFAGSHDKIPGMESWLAALAGRHFTTCALSCLGTSVTEGNGSSTWERTYPALLQTALNNKFPSIGLSSHGMGALPPVVNNGQTPDFVSVTGTPTPVSGYGFNRYTYDISAGGGCTVVYTVKITTGYICFANQPGGGDYTWKLDSGSENTVHTNGDLSDTQFVAVNADETPDVTHTITIAAAGNGPVWLDGLAVFNGDESSGIQVNNYGASGSTSEDWAGQDVSIIGASPTNMYILEIVGNDWAGGTVTTEQSKANLATVCDNLVAANAAEGSPVPQFIILILFNSSTAGPDDPPWSDYVRAQYEFATTRTDTSVFDLSIRMGTGVPNGPYGEFAADGEHPSDLGASLIADMLCSYLSPQ